MARLNLKRRTRQIDASREISLGNGVHSTVGDLTVTQDQKDEATSQIRATQRAGLVEKIVVQIQARAAAMLGDAMEKLAPASLDTTPEAFEAWRLREGYSFRQDDLTSVLLKRGKVMATWTAQVHAGFRDEVIEEIRRQQRQATTT